MRGPWVLAYVNREQTDLRKQRRDVGGSAMLSLVRLPTVPLLALAQ